MHIRDYLNDIPLKALKTIADALDVDVEYRARIKLVNAVDRAFWDGGLVKRLTGELSPRHRFILSILAFSYKAGVPGHALARKAEKLEGMRKQEKLDVVHDLIRLSLVVGLAEDGDNHYFCPGGIAEQVRRLLIDAQPIATHAAAEFPQYSQPHLIEDIFSFLACVHKQALPLTLMGRVRKATLDRIFSGSPTCKNAELHFTHEHRDAFVVEYLRARGLVEFGRREVYTTPRLENWLALSATERTQDIVAFALKHIVHDSETIITLAGLFPEMETGTVFDTASLMAFLHGRTAAPGGEKRLGSRIRDLLAVLLNLGLLSSAGGFFTVNAAGAKFFRGERLPAEEAVGMHFIIQPNFEVILGPELEPHIRFTLELMADRKRRDTVMTYVVVQEGIARARERGMSTDEVMRFFHDHSRNPLPQNVRFSIEAWAESYGSIFFENTTLMRCRNAEICDSIVHAPDIAPYIMEKLSDSVLIVSSGNIPILSALLKKAGFLPEAFIENGQVSSHTENPFDLSTVPSMIEDLSLPVIHRNFIFPDYLLSGGDES